MKTTQEDIRETAGQFNARNGWAVEPAIALAKEVMEDCNAHGELALFNAAPDLLAALKRLVLHLPKPEHVRGTPQWESGFISATLEAVSAISKAERGEG